MLSMMSRTFTIHSDIFELSTLWHLRVVDTLRHLSELSTLQFLLYILMFMLSRTSKIHFDQLRVTDTATNTLQFDVWSMLLTIDVSIVSSTLSYWHCNYYILMSMLHSNFQIHSDIVELPTLQLPLSILMSGRVFHPLMSQMFQTLWVADTATNIFHLVVHVADTTLHLVVHVADTTLHLVVHVASNISNSTLTSSSCRHSDIQGVVDTATTTLHPHVHVAFELSKFTLTSSSYWHYFTSSCPSCLQHFNNPLRHLRVADTATTTLQFGLWSMLFHPPRIPTLQLPLYISLFHPDVHVAFELSKSTLTSKKLLTLQLTLSILLSGPSCRRWSMLPSNVQNPLWVLTLQLPLYILMSGQCCRRWSMMSRTFKFTLTSTPSCWHSDNNLTFSCSILIPNPIQLFDLTLLINN